MTEDNMVGWYHQLNGHEFEQTVEDSEGQGSLACCSPWVSKESDTTQQLNNSYLCRQNSKAFGNSKLKSDLTGCYKAIFIQVGGYDMFYLIVYNLIYNI